MSDPHSSVGALTQRHLTVACAESLTGGLLASAFVDVPGASAVFRGCAVCYATEAKASVLGVDSELLDAVGPVDGEVALQMARGARDLFGADIGIATTGVAGPGPADGHPAGTVWVAVAGALGEGRSLLRLAGDRAAVRTGAVEGALGLLDNLMAHSQETPSEAR